ncbi:unnamed protein product, partial [Sphacelaria rigidula]
MVRVIFAPNSDVEALPSAWDRSSEYDSKEQAGAGHPFAHANTQASICLFWGSIALGGLVQGWPMSEVAHYIRRAEAALQACPDSTNQDTARAHVALAIVCSFTGNKVKFSEHLYRADAIIQQLGSGAVQDDFAELVTFADEVRAVHGNSEGSDEVLSFCRA